MMLSPRTSRYRSSVTKVALILSACVSVSDAWMHVLDPSVPDLPGLVGAPVLDREFRRPNPSEPWGLYAKSGSSDPHLWCDNTHAMCDTMLEAPQTWSV